MKTISQTQITCSACFLALAATVSPAAAQLGLGRAAGSVSGTVQGTTHAAISEPARGPQLAPTRQAPLTGSALSVTQDTHLSSRLNTMLPASTSLPVAAAGFENESEFVTALHTAHNLNLPFDQLKGQMTGRNSASLNKAVRKLRPDLDGKQIGESVSLARRQAERDMAQANTGGKPDKVATHILANQQLVARITPMLPPNQSVAEAATGFRNEGQFLATLHAANNHGIAFTELKDRVTAGQSLGAAMQDLKPGMGAQAAAEGSASADAQAKQDKVEVSASAKTSASASLR